MLGIIFTFIVISSILVTTMQRPSGKDANGSDRLFARYNVSDELYELYCRFKEESRVSLLRLSVRAATRRFLVEHMTPLSKEEFSGSIQKMLPTDRVRYLKRLRIGYRQACEEAGLDIFNELSRPI